jgi:hypothetical protein
MQVSFLIKYQWSITLHLEYIKYMPAVKVDEDASRQPTIFTNGMSNNIHFQETVRKAPGSILQGNGDVPQPKRQLNHP